MQTRGKGGAKGKSTGAGVANQDTKGCKKEETKKESMASDAAGRKEVKSDWHT